MWTQRLKKVDMLSFKKKYVANNSDTFTKMVQLKSELKYEEKWKKLNFPNCVISICYVTFVENSSCSTALSVLQESWLVKSELILNVTGFNF